MRRDLIAERVFLEKLRELGLGRVDGRGKLGVVRARDADGPGGIRPGELLLNVSRHHVTGTREQLLHLVVAEVVGEHAGDVGLGQRGVELQAVAKLGVPGGIEFPIRTGESAERLDEIRHLHARRTRDPEFVGEVQGRMALQAVVLHLRFIQSHVTHLKVHADGGIAKHPGVVFLAAQIQAEEGPVQRLVPGIAETRGGADREYEGNDHEHQQHQEDDAEVLLKSFLDPRDHGVKRTTLRRPGWVSIALRACSRMAGPGGGLRGERERSGRVRPGLGDARGRTG